MTKASVILGFVKVRHSGSHVILRRGPKGCVVPTHSDVKVGTLAGSVRMPVQTLLDYLESGESIDDFLAGFPSVSREQVAAGPLAGLEGVFETASGDARVVVLLELLGKTNRLTVNRDWLVAAR